MKGKGILILSQIGLNHLNCFDFIVIGVFLFTLTNSVLFFYLPQYIWWILDSISVLLFVLGLFTSHRISQVDADIIACAICMIVYAIILLFVSIVNFELNYPHLITQQAYFLPYLFPFLILIGINLETFHKIYQYLYLGCFLALLFLISNSYGFIFNTAEVYGKMHDDADSAVWGGLFFWLSMVIAGCPFYMAISVYYMSHITKGNFHKSVIALTILISIIFALSFGRRMAALSGIVFLFSPLLINVFISKNRKKYFFLLFFLCLLLSFFFSQIIELFPILEKRLDIDTRGGLIDDLIIDFNIWDWIWGRGLDATYRSPSGLGGDSIRNMVESGYLDIILHAGLIYLVLFVYIMLRAVYLGMLKGRNIIVKSAGLYLLIHLIMMCTQARPYFSLDYLMVYIAICICGSKKWRKMEYDSRII